MHISHARVFFVCLFVCFISPEVELLGHMVTYSTTNILRNCQKLFCKVATPFYIPINNV